MSANHLRPNDGASPGGDQSASPSPRTLRRYRLLTLCLLCLSDGTYTVLRRYSRGILEETYSVQECLLLAEVIKTAFSAWMVGKNRTMEDWGADGRERSPALPAHLLFLLASSRKMLVLAVAYLFGNMLSFFALARVSAGTFAVIAQGKTFTTAMFSVLMLRRSFSWTKWRAMATQVAGVVLFVLPTLDSAKGAGTGLRSGGGGGGAILAGILAELAVITLSGAASIYFERAIKSDPTDIWERNFQLGFHSIFMYAFLIAVIQPKDEDGASRLFSRLTPLALVLSVLAATGGLLVALSIKYGDSVLKTLAISGSIIYAAVIDRALLGGPLTVQMVFAAIVVIVSIVNYTFDTTPEPSPISQAAVVLSQQQHPGLAKQERLERGEASTREL
jgi:UDP-sugar transporter A1/2/3